MFQPSLLPAAITVSALTGYLRQLFESDPVLQDVWVQGEISNLSRPTSGHIYLTLKDAQAALRCVIWRSSAARLRLNLQNGLMVEAHGALSLYEKDGQYQLYIDAVRPVGEGVLYQEFLRLKARLEAEGLFDEARKRPIPERVQRIGLVTSPTGAALQDMLNTLRRRWPLVEVILAPCPVQGEDAPPAIVAALEALNTLPIPPDVILLARGGGSLEDLWAFNDERVVRAVAASSRPTITGIGHETDFTLADYAADWRAPTPTGAAVRATPDLVEEQAVIGRLDQRLEAAALQALDNRQSLAEALGQRLQRVSPDWRIQNNRQQVDQLVERGERALQTILQMRRLQTQGVCQRLETINPLAVLQRGYALVSRETGGVLQSVHQAVPGEKIQVRLVDGTLQAQIISVEEHKHE
jgi:exodeoxyribonuclease VII large subunit